MNWLTKFNGNRGLAPINNKVSNYTQRASVSSVQANTSPVYDYTDYSIPVPFWKNKFVWLTTGLLFLLSAFTTHAFMGADIGSFVDKPYSARAFGILYFLGAILLGAFFQFINKWNGITVNFLRGYTPFLLLLIINVVSMVLFFFIGPVLIFYTIGLFKLVLPYTIGFLLSTWVFSDLSFDEIQAIKANLRQKRAMRMQMRPQASQAPMGHQPVPYGYGDSDYGAPRPPAQHYNGNDTYGAPVNRQSLYGRNPRQLRDHYDYSDYPRFD